MSTPTVRLTDDEIEFFHRVGYLQLDALTAPDEVEELQEIYDELFTQRAEELGEDHFDLVSSGDDQAEPTLPQVMHPSKHIPALAETQLRTNADAIARQLLGEEAVFDFDHAIRKPPDIGSETPWHQDEAYWDPALCHEALSIWVPLQEATVENGCLHFIPGSNRSGVKPHHNIYNDPEVIGLEIDEVDPSKGVACPLPLGGATIHHCRTVHYAGSNVSDSPRRAYIIAYHLPPKQRETPRDFHWLKK